MYLKIANKVVICCSPGAESWSLTLQIKECPQIRWWESGHDNHRGYGVYQTSPKHQHFTPQQCDSKHQECSNFPVVIPGCHVNAGEALRNPHLTRARLRGYAQVSFGRTVVNYGELLRTQRPFVVNCLVGAIKKNFGVIIWWTELFIKKGGCSIRFFKKRGDVV